MFLPLSPFGTDSRNGWHCKQCDLNMGQLIEGEAWWMAKRLPCKERVGGGNTLHGQRFRGDNCERREKRENTKKGMNVCELV